MNQMDEDVPADILSEAAIKLERLNFFGRTPSDDKLNALFRKIAHTEDMKLKELWTDNMDKDVPADIFAEAAVKLERVSFFGRTPSDEQLTALFRKIVDTDALKLKEFCVSVEKPKAFQYDEEVDVFCEAAVRLEVLDIPISSDLADCLLRKIVETEDMKLKTVHSVDTTSVPADTLIEAALKVNIHRSDGRRPSLSGEYSRDLFRKGSVKFAISR